MKRVEATIQPSLLDAVREELFAGGMRRITVAEVSAIDPRARTASYRGSTYVAWFAPQIKIEVVILDEQLDDCVDAIRTFGKLDDAPMGGILVSVVDDAMAMPHLRRRPGSTAAGRRQRIASLVRR